MSDVPRKPAPNRRSAESGAVFVCGLWLCGVLLGLVSGCTGGTDEAASPSTTQSDLESLYGAIYDPPKPAPALRLTDSAGRAFDLSTERGNVVLIFFGFTECPDICPATLQHWARARAALGPASSRVRFVFVSIDPEHDTPAIAAEYARRFDPSFVGLSGTVAEIGQVALAWGVSKGRAHTSQVLVVNRDGLIPWGYGRSATIEEIVRGIREIEKSGD